MSEHTALPWAVIGVTGGMIEVGIKDTDFEICTLWRGDENDAAKTQAELKANAQHIVTAANYHHRLVESLRALRDQVDLNLDDPLPESIKQELAQADSLLAELEADNAQE